MKYFLIFLFCTCVLEAKTICLNMIVKNESKVIERCLNSLKDHIDYWVIVDTGSTDGTQEIIRQCMKGKPGELHEKPWINFGYNRNEALDLARNKGDYVLFIDADEGLRFEPSFNKNALVNPYYYAVMLEPNGIMNRRMLLIDKAHAWKWIGAIHETIYCEGVGLDFHNTVDGVQLINFQDGHRSCDPNKFLKDAQVLEEELKKDPTNSRYVFYLAQCYLNAKQKTLALENYERRVQMEPYSVSNEKWYALYTIARLHDELGYPSDLVTREYCQAFQLRPIRAEPLGCLALHHFRQGNYILSYALAVQALSIPKPQDSYFVEDHFYDYIILYAYADSALQLGLKDQALQAYLQLLKCEKLPADVRAQTEKIINR